MAPERTLGVSDAEETPRAHEWFTGDFRSWEEARAASTGYDDPAILQRVIAATRKVVSGEAAYERDSVSFDHVEYSVPLLACLLYAASRLGNRLNLVDIGGSLGSTYRQNRRFLSHLSELRWSIVEQPHFVAAGKAEFETEELRFYETIATCATASSPRVALLSSVLPYIEKPYELLAAVFEGALELVIVERTPFFLERKSERVTVEHVPPEIYPASYPAWFFDLETFRSFVERSPFAVVAEFDSWESWETNGEQAQSKCFLLERHGAPAECPRNEGRSRHTIE